MTPQEKAEELYNIYTKVLVKALYHYWQQVKQEIEKL